MTLETLVEVSKIQMSYGAGQKRFIAIQNINLWLFEGQFVALLGPSGCGKSTLLRIITGLQQPSEGKVLYRGRALKGVNPNATIVFQTFALFPWLTVQENVELALQMRGVAPDVRAEQSVKLLDQVGLDGFESAYPRELSGGMRQKVGFARAMAVEPELLCLDEPFSALDPLSAETLRGELLELWTGGNIPTKAVLMVSHNIDEAVFLADRIVVMDRDPGRVVADLQINLAHPRDRKSAEYQALVDNVYATLAGQTRPEAEELGTAPGEPGRTRKLPPVSVSRLAAMLEFLGDQPANRMDIYKLEDELGIDLDSILPLTEASELLGYATIEKGDIILTSLGETFAEAGILARKEIFATRIRRVPLFRWLMALLRSGEKNRLRVETLRTALELEFPPEDTERQINTMIDWGRYAELIQYDDDEEVITLEPVPAR
jgi:NitT/TauT family transport system ATP-binding protein